MGAVMMTIRVGTVNSSRRKNDETELDSQKASLTLGLIIPSIERKKPRTFNDDDTNGNREEQYLDMLLKA